ncbi:MAG: hypothetical protein ACHQ52_11345 [Candidatus Eisenbacteria bacterium]
MFSLVGLVLGFTALVVLGVMAMVFSLVVGLVTLPFRILGFGIKLLVGLLFLPFFLLLGVFGFGLGLLFLMARLLPLVLLIAGIVWLVRRGRRPNVVNGARV